jgi:hypothetical protein
LIGGEAQAVKHLPSKHEALISSPSITPPKKHKNQYYTSIKDRHRDQWHKEPRNNLSNIQSIILNKGAKTTKWWKDERMDFLTHGAKISGYKHVKLKWDHCCHHNSTHHLVPALRRVSWKDHLSPGAQDQPGQKSKTKQNGWKV